MSDRQASYPIATMCRLLGVSSSGYYAWAKRPRSRRAQTDDTVLTEIRIAHGVSRGTYGAPRVHAELAAKGIRVGRKRIARLMSQAGLAGVSRRRFVITTVKGSNRQAPDLVERNFTSEKLDQLWVADITYIPTWAGFLYLAVVLDACTAGLSVGRWPRHLLPDWCLMLWTWRSQRADPQASSITPTRVRNTHQSNSATAAVRRVCVRQWVRWETPTTMPCAKASSPLWNVSFSRDSASRRKPRRKVQSSSSSRASTIRDVATHRSDISRRSITSTAITPRQWIPTHTSLPPCSRPSRTSPSGGSKKRPSLTAAARDSRTIVRVGTEEWLRRGPN